MAPNPGIVAQVRRLRIRVAVAAWAYEKNLKATMTDEEYDQLCLEVHETRNLSTANHKLDRFYQRHFDPDTGLWIHKHPDPAGLERIYYQVFYPMLYAHEIKRARQRENRRKRKNR